jgi:class 3 adenylate cyclase
VFALDWGSHLEAMMEQPFIVEWFASLARFARVLWFDMRGTGMSGPMTEESPIEGWMHDLDALMHATGAERPALVAHGHACQMGVVAAATHPERLASLVLFNGYARFTRADDYPAGLPTRLHEAFLDAVESHWGSGIHAAGLGPSVAGRPGVEEWWARVERYGGTPRVARARLETIFATDVRNVLPLVKTPTLVVHNAGDVFVPVGHGRYLAEHIPGARLLERDSADHWPVPEPDLVAAIEEFVTGSRSESRDEDRVLATVLFVDVVASTEHATEVGDPSWRRVLDRLEQTARELLVAYDGKLEDTTGDGFLATFDGPARGIRCASRIRDEVRRLGVVVRCGLHAGEVTTRESGISGIAVHIGARVSALAQPGEVLVTRTVRDLVAGSGISFEERGEHALKGVPDTWQLYAATG